MLKYTCLIFLVLGITNSIHCQENASTYFIESSTLDETDEDDGKYIEFTVTVFEVDSILMSQSINVTIDLFDGDKYGSYGFIRYLEGQKILAEFDLYDNSVYVTNFDSLVIQNVVTYMLDSFCYSRDPHSKLNDFLSHELSAFLSIIRHERLTYDYAVDGYAVEVESLHTDLKEQTYKTIGTSKTEYCNYTYQCLLKRNERVSEYRSGKRKNEYDKLPADKKRLVTKKAYAQSIARFENQQSELMQESMEKALQRCVKMNQDDRVKISSFFNNQESLEFKIERSYQLFPFGLTQGRNKLKEVIKIYSK